MSEWIRTDERQPEEHGIYNVICDGFPGIAGWTKDGWRDHRFMTPLFYNDGIITHWASLPPAPDDLDVEFSMVEDEGEF